MATRLAWLVDATLNRLQKASGSSLNTLVDSGIADAVTGGVASLTATLTGNHVYTLPDATGTFALGAGTASYLAYWSGVNTLTGSSSLTWSGSALAITGNLTFGVGASRYIQVADQTAANSSGDGLYFQGAKGKGNGSGGPGLFTAGSGDLTGPGGDFVFTAGMGGATSGNGGNIRFYGGGAFAFGSGGNGGDITFAPGLAIGAGTPGHVQIAFQPASTEVAVFDVSLIASSSKTFTFPNVTGTFALGAGTATVSSTNDVTVTSHTHAVTSSSNPGAAASILASDASGYLQVVRLGAGVAPNESVEVAGNIRIPVTTSTVGWIKQGTNRLIGVFGTGNHWFGVGAGNLTLSGTYNVIIGTAGRSLTSGTYNVLIGEGCGDGLQSGGTNVALGYYAMPSITTGGSNFALGFQALFTAGTDTGSNVAIGRQALYYANPTYHDVAIGYQALFNLTTGYYQTAIGFQAGYNQQAVNGSVFIGWRAGYYETGANVLFIDNAARTNEATARIQAMIYGQFNATISSQILTLNAVTKCQMYSADTNAVRAVLEIHDNSTGTPAAGLGGALDWYLHSSTTVDQLAARISAVWNDATHASRKADLVVYAYDTAAREGVRIRGGGSAAELGFFGATPVAQQTGCAIPTDLPSCITAITALRTALNNLGLTTVV